MNDEPHPAERDVSDDRSDLDAIEAAPGSSAPPARAWRWFRRAALYPNAYTWFVLLGALDIMLTWVVLHMGGREVNVLADWIIRRWALPGMVVFKFVLVMVVVIICEIVGRHSARAGRRLAKLAVIITAIPVVLSFVQMLIEVYVPAPGGTV